MARWLGKLDSVGAVATMSGSGATVFGLFSKRVDAEKAARRLRRDGSRPWVAVARTLDREEIRRRRFVGERQQGEE